MDFFRSLIPDFAKQFFYDFGKYILFLGLPTIIGAFYWVANSLKDNFLSGLPVGFILGIFFWLFFFAFLSQFRKHEHASLIVVDPPYKILEENTLYQHLSRTNIKYLRKLKLEILKDGVDAFNGKYLWTGHSQPTISVTDPSQQFIEIRQQDAHRFYEVKFGARTKKDIVHVEILMELDDTAQNAVPMFSHTVLEPTDHLMIKLVFPSGGLVNKTLKTSEYPHYSAKKSISTADRDVRLDEFSWTITKPIVYHRYLIQWTWR